MPSSSTQPVLQHRDALTQIARRFGLERLTLVGSRARGDARPDSDADFLYRLRPGVRLGFGLFSMEQQMAEVLGVKVESLDEAAVSPIWADHVHQATVVLFDDAAQRSTASARAS